MNEISREADVVTALKACLHCFDEMRGRKPSFVEDAISISKEAIDKYESQPPSSRPSLSAESKLRMIFSAWNEFGPECGFGELMDRLQEHS